MSDKLSKYKSIFISLDYIDNFNIAACESPCDLCKIATLVGGKALESAAGAVDAARNRVAIDTVLSFPFNSAEDTTVIFSLRDVDTDEEVAKHVLPVSQFENRDASMSAKMKLKNGKDQAVGFLNAKIKMAETVLIQATAARNLKSAESGEAAVYEASTVTQSVLKLITQRVPDTVDNYDVNLTPTRMIQLTLFNLTDCRQTPNEIKVWLGTQNLSTPCTGLMIDKTFKFKYNGERFLRLSLNNGDSTIGEGGIDLSNFVTRRQNICGGSLAFEGVAGQMAVGFFRMQRSSMEGEVGVGNAENYGGIVIPESQASLELGGAWV